MGLPSGWVILAYPYSVSTKASIKLTQVNRKMGTVRKVFKTGNSIVVSLPKEISDALHLGEGSEVVVELDEARRQIMISPVKSTAADVDPLFAKQVAEFIEEYRPALEALAQ